MWSAKTKEERRTGIRQSFKYYQKRKKDKALNVSIFLIISEQMVLILSLPMVDNLFMFWGQNSSKRKITKRKKNFSVESRFYLVKLNKFSLMFSDKLKILILKIIFNTDLLFNYNL